MAVAFPLELPRTDGLPDATPMLPDTSTGVDQGWPITAVLAQIEHQLDEDPIEETSKRRNR